MFKKRTRPTSVRDKPRTEDEDKVKSAAGEDGEGGAAASGSGSGLEALVDDSTGDGGEDGDDVAQTIEELVLLRRLRKSQAQQGIDLAKLNRGEEKKSKGKKKDGEGVDEGGGGGGATSGFGPSKGRKAEEKDEDEDDNERAKRLVRSNNFTQQTNALDVDKHMMAYIETELAKRRGQAAEETASGKRDEPFDPQAELYKIADRYKIEVRKGVKEDEGSVTNSLGMLTSIPEVDLGMDNRLKNIENTEKAKREMMEQRRLAVEEAARRKAEPEPDYASARFYRPHQRVASDIYAVQEAKRQSDGLPARHESATDEQVYERFKKRMKH